MGAQSIGSDCQPDHTFSPMISKQGQRLTDLDRWRELAGPKRPNQWKINRSAMECARCSLDVEPPALPPEIEQALGSHPDFGPVLSWDAEPEVQLKVDDRPGEPRNTDMLILARDARGEFLVAEEAKADERFDLALREVLVNAFEARVANPRSGAVARALDLVTTLLGPRGPGDTKLGALRYQLFTAAVGALREAEDRKLTRAVLLIHEFVTDATSDVKHLVNDADLGLWLSRLSRGRYLSVPKNTVVGPIDIPGSPLLSGTARLYVGKAVRNLRSSTSYDR